MAFKVPYILHTRKCTGAVMKIQITAQACAQLNSLLNTESSKKNRELQGSIVS